MDKVVDQPIIGSTRKDVLPMNEGSRTQQDANDSNLPALLLGLGVGLAVGFLAAPRSGEKTRELLAAKARQGVARAADAADELRLQFETGLSTAEEAVQELKDRVQDSVADTKVKVQEAIRAGQNAYRQSLSESETAEPGPASRAATSGS
jgi:gas vesicle protein